MFNFRFGELDETVSERFIIKFSFRWTSGLCRITVAHYASQTPTPSSAPRIILDVRRFGTPCQEIDRKRSADRVKQLGFVGVLGYNGDKDRCDLL